MSLGRHLFAVLLVACGSDLDPGGGAVAGAETGDAQTPPTGASAVESWLRDGAYKSWACEADRHPARSPSPHGTDRVCSNTLLSKNTAATYPVGAAAVKELYEADGTIRGYAVYRKITTGGGEAWYWYERASGKLNADGIGSSGDIQRECVDCHSGAKDFVYTQVK